MSPQPKLVRAVVVAALLLASVGPTHALSSAEERVFFSDDVDQDVDSVSGNFSDPGTYAKVSDIAYRTTFPQYEIDSTTVTEFRQSELQALETDDDVSYALPDSDTTTGPYRHVSDAHITFVGVAGGARPRLEGSDRTFIAESGLLLNHVDYRNTRPVPGTDCDNTQYDFLDFDIDGDNVSERVYTDGSRTCDYYSTTSSVDRWVEIDGQRFDGNETIPYSNLDAGTTTVELHAEITSTLLVRETEEDWDPNIRESTSISDGDWDVTDATTSVENQTTMTVTDSHAVRVTDNGNLSVEQVLVNADGRQFSVLSFEGASNISERVLWNYIRFGDDEYVRGIWDVYSVREHRSGYLYDGSGRRSVSARGTPLRQYLLPTANRPRVGNFNGTPQTAVVRFNSTPAGNLTNIHPNVNLNGRAPVLYDSIILRNPPQPASSVVTIHGKEIPIDVDNRVEYRRPTVELTAVGDERVRVHVEDPETGDPLTGRTVRLSGTGTQTATTDSNGNVVVDRVSPFVRALVVGDDWAEPGGNVLYGTASASDTFVASGVVLARLYSLAQTAALLSPLVLLYFYIRTYGFFE